MKGGIIKLAAALMVAAGLAASPAHANPATPFKPVESKTYLVNGLVSAVPFIGYGLTNLKKKMDGARLLSYVSPIEGSAVIQPAILRQVREAYRRNPSVQINLIGISYGANLVTAIAARLARDGIPVNYLGVIDGRLLTKVHANVRKVDNFTCSFIDCIGERVRLAAGNRTTEKVEFRFRSPHIALGNNGDMHNRVIQQSNPYQAAPYNAYGVDPIATASVPRTQ